MCEHVSDFAIVIATQPGWKPYKTVQLDTLKLYTKAHGNKTTNLIINLDHDDWIFEDDTATLLSLGLENEAEVSFFNRALYEEFKLNPEVSNRSSADCVVTRTDPKNWCRQNGINFTAISWILYSRRSVCLRNNRRFALT